MPVIGFLCVRLRVDLFIELNFGIGFSPQQVQWLHLHTSCLPELSNTHFFYRSRDSSVGIATGCRLNDPGSISGSAKFFYSPQLPDRLWGPPGLLPNGYRGLFSPDANRQEREADHSPPCSAKVKKVGAIPPLPHMSSWHRAQLIKHRDNYCKCKTCVIVTRWPGRHVWIGDLSTLYHRQ
jgi:hypothetical protein